MDTRHCASWIQTEVLCVMDTRSKRSRRWLGSNLRSSVLPDRRYLLLFLVIFNIILFILFCYIIYFVLLHHNIIHICINWMLRQYILIISVHIFTVTTNTFIIKLAGAVDSTTLPTTPEKSSVNVQYRFCYVNMFICFHILVPIYSNACFSYSSISIMKYNYNYISITKFDFKEIFSQTFI